MSGCSLDEAFPDTAQQSGRIARKEEKKRAQKCKGPALTFLKSQEDDVDPDRPAEKPSPHTQPLTRPSNKEGFFSAEPADTYEKESPKWTPMSKTAEQEKESELVKNLVGQRVDDVIGQKQRSTLPKASLIRPSPATSSTSSNYFGKSLDDNTEQFANFNSSLSDNPGYQILSDLGSFGAVGLERSAGHPMLATPSVNDAWKPLTPSGARSSFFEHLPSPGGMSPRAYDSSFSRQEKENLLKKLDTLFARLEELESKRNEYAHTEISLFILSGLFLMFGIETARKMI